MSQQASLDEYLSKRSQRVGKTASGKEAVFKGFAAPTSWSPETRSAVFIMSSERIDRDGDIVRQKGIALDDFEKNPQVLLFHSSRDWPVGKWSDVQKKLRSDPKHTQGTLNFAPAGGPIPEVDQAAWAVENGLIRTVSIGFMPLELEMIEHKDGESPWSYGFDILASDLFECSLVPIPAQPDAVAKGMIEKGEFQPAREFIEQAFDEWARDPRTSMFVPKKELSDTYRRFFGKSAVMVMALDSTLPVEKSALRRVEDAIAKAAEDHGLKQLPMPTDPLEDPAEPADGEIEAVSGIEIEFPITVNLTITQGNTGANTRVGTDVGDAGTNAADANVNGASQRDAVIEQKEPHPMFGRIKGALKRFFGEESATQEPKLVPGAYELRKDRLSTVAERLRALQGS